MRKEQPKWLRVKDLIFTLSKDNTSKTFFRQEFINFMSNQMGYSDSRAQKLLDAKEEMKVQHKEMEIVLVFFQHFFDKLIAIEEDFNQKDILVKNRPSTLLDLYQNSPIDKESIIISLPQMAAAS